MGFIICTDEKGCKVWRNDEGQYPRYSVSFSKKNEDGSYTNAYQSVKFKKGVSVENGTMIHIRNAFPSFTEYQGKKYPYWMITDFVTLDSNGEPVSSDFVNVPEGSEEDLPW
ncbi:MAG: hypothetical protein IIY21_20495 [Clostridiales bacterium]|nr:hypothetical protein [Clostridiales bacterium]MBQ1572344.1 hypothetical protein [Clostridiales bacterium]